jgi:hypothetical protein
MGVPQPGESASAPNPLRRSDHAKEVVSTRATHSQTRGEATRNSQTLDAAERQRDLHACVASAVPPEPALG